MRIKNFEDFTDTIVNLENKYPRNFLYPVTFFIQLQVQHLEEIALWKYLKREVKTPLPSPTGSLSRAISSGGIVAANKEVQHVVESINDGTLLKRGPYEDFDDKERAQVGRYAAVHGVAAAVRHYQKLFLTRKVKESSVHTWRNNYL